MNQSKNKVTSRKFYGKWLYKVSIKCKGASVFRFDSINKAIEFCYDSENNERPYSLGYKVYHHKTEILEIANVLNHYAKEIYSKRIEGDVMDIYTNDVAFYEDISSKFENILVHRFAPDPQTIELLSQSQSYVTVKKLPHDRYNYRVYLLPHKMAGDKEGKQRFLNWVKTQGDKITCTNAVEKWFLKTDWNWDRRYVLVQDEQTLLMLKLRNNEIVGRIYNFIVSDK
jgi:hypothetical protein